jgi:hypothetical protein
MHVLTLELVDSHAHKSQDESVVRRSFEDLRYLGFMQFPGYRCRRSGGRHGAPCEDADRAPTAYPHQFCWYLASSLPTDDTISFLLPRIPTPFKWIIWIASAGIAEVPFLVGLFLSHNYTVFTSAFCRSLSFSI